MGNAPPLENEELLHAVDLRFGDPKFNVIDREEFCPACSKAVTREGHCDTCFKLRWCIKFRHDNMVRWIIY